MHIQSEGGGGGGEREKESERKGVELGREKVIK